MNEAWPELTAYLHLVGLEVPNSTISLDHLVDEVLPEGQRRVGELWEAGSWSVAQEHIATEAARKVLASATSRYTPDPSRSESMVSVCADGEWHALAADSLALSLEFAGYHVVRTRQSTQPAHVSSLIHDHGPRAVTISCSMAANLPGAYRMIQACLDTGTPVVVGGSGFGTDDTRAKLLGATAWARRVSEVKAIAPGLKGGKGIRPLRDSLPVDFSLTAGPNVAGALSRSLIDGSPHDVEAVTIGTWLLRSLRASILCADPTILSEHVTWQRARSLSSIDPALDPILLAVRDAIPAEAGTARDMITQHIDG